MFFIDKSQTNYFDIHSVKKALGMDLFRVLKSKGTTISHFGAEFECGNVMEGLSYSGH